MTLFNYRVFTTGKTEVTSERTHFHASVQALENFFNYEIQVHDAQEFTQRWSD